MTSRLSPIFTSLIGAAAAALAIGCSFPTAGQVTAITHQSQNISAIQQTMLLADSAFKFDPTLVLTGSALDNARLIYPNMIANAIDTWSKNTQS